MVHKCNFCGTEFAFRSALCKHLTTAKYCLKQRAEQSFEKKYEELEEKYKEIETYKKKIKELEETIVRLQARNSEQLKIYDVVERALFRNPQP